MVHHAHAASPANAPDLQPRKLPRQARAKVTVDAIVEATMQVLTRADGATPSTTHIARRAGVSVGSLYQYFPHRDALLHEVLQRQLDGVACALEQLCQRHCGDPVAMMASGFANAYLDLKIARVPERITLHAHIEALGMTAAQAALMQRGEAALATLLASAPDAAFGDAAAIAAPLLRDLLAMTWPTLRTMGDPADPGEACTLGALRHEVVRHVRNQLGVSAFA